MFSFAFGLLTVSAQQSTKAKNESLQADVTPSIVEVIGKKGNIPDRQLLEKICLQSGMKHPLIYQWENHLIAYGKIADESSLEKKVRKAFPGREVKGYDHPFYNFNRRQCSNKDIAREWDNIILTADLVKDTAMQHQYLRYHADQAKDWPEVAQGFCNASFQQLLVYKTGRQLMLVISIPKGASLDELNPRTTQNNPRVDEWNNLMKNYQEGIPGTKPGEVWVFFKPLN